MGRKKGVALSAILMITEVFSTLLLTPFMIRALGQAEYGVYKLTSSVSTYLMLLDLGMSGAVIRFIASYKERQDHEKLNQFFGVSQLYYLAIALIAGICGVVIYFLYPTVFAVGLTPEEVSLAQRLLLILAANAVITLGTSVFRNAMIAYSAFGAAKGSGIIRNVLRILITWLALRAGLGSVAVVSINLLLTTIERGYFVLYVFKNFHIRPCLRGVTRSFVGELVGYSSLILLQLVATQINDQAGSVLLGMFVPGAALVIAVYGVGTQVVQYFKSIASAFTDVLMPGVVRLVEHGADAAALQHEMSRVGRIIMLVLLAILSGFSIYGMQFIELWTGVEYREAYCVALVIMTAFMFICTEYIGNQIMWAKNYHKELAIIKFVVVIVNVPLTAALIKWNPLLGAAVGTFISLVAGDVVALNITLKRKIGISIWGYYKSLLHGMIPTVLATILFDFAFSRIGLCGWGGFVCNVAAHCLVYCSLCWLWTMNASEKNMLLGILKKFTKKRTQS